VLAGYIIRQYQAYAFVLNNGAFGQIGKRYQYIVGMVYL
jgi:hypothetical protein